MLADERAAIRLKPGIDRASSVSPIRPDKASSRTPPPVDEFGVSSLFMADPHSHPLPKRRDDTDATAIASAVACRRSVDRLAGAVVAVLAPYCEHAERGDGGALITATTERLAGAAASGAVNRRLGEALAGQT